MGRRPLTILLALATALVGASAAHARVDVHRDAKSGSEIRKYWTAERMRNAIPVDRTNRPGKDRLAKPSGSRTGATSFEAPLPYPDGHGKVFFSDGAYNYVCSGSALASANQSVVWTAGHCVNEGPGRYYTNFLFVPAYRNGAEPYGRFAAPTLLTTERWRTSGEYGVDLGAAVVGRNAAGQTLNEAVTGERSLVFNSARQQSYKLYGYPAAGKFNGQTMRVCDTAWSRDDASGDPDTMGVPCDMTGGSSGGGWVTAGGQVASVVSYGYGSLKNVLFGPYQSTEAQQLFAAAETS